MDKYINRGNHLILATKPSFYTVPAPDAIKDEYFVIAGAIELLKVDLDSLYQAIGDVPSEAQVEQVNDAYETFVKTITPKPVTKTVRKKVKK